MSATGSDKKRGLANIRLYQALVCAVLLLAPAQGNAQTITTIAGGDIGDGRHALDASLNRPSDIFQNSSGEMFIADTFNNRIRKVDIFGQISTIAGGGILNAFSADGALATDADLPNLTSLFIDSQDNLHFLSNGMVWRLNTNGTLSKIAGGGSGGLGDDGIATSARLSHPRGLYVDEAGNLLIADALHHRIRRVDAATGIITTIAGTGTAGYSGDNSPATSANLNQPSGIFQQGSNIYIADFGNDRIRMIDHEGTITTIAGNGTRWPANDNGPATLAGMNQPNDVFMDNDNNLLIAEWGGSRVRKVDVSGIITTVAGNGSGGFSGDGGLASNSVVRNPLGVYVNGNGNIWISDTGNNRIRKIDESTNIIETVAGGTVGDGRIATEAVLALQNRTQGIVMDAAGNLYIPDSEHNLVRKVDGMTKIISTIAGGGTSFSEYVPAISASLNTPSAVRIDDAGNIYISEFNGFRVRKIDPSGIISTVAGGSGFGYTGDGGAATLARLGNVSDIAIDSHGNLYIADSRSVVRRVNAATGNIETIAGIGTPGFSGDSGPAVQAMLSNPSALALSDEGEIFIADTDNHRIRKIDANGLISTIAGGGSAGWPHYGDGGPATLASLNRPLGMAFDASGNLLISDSHKVRLVNLETGQISTVAGSGNFGFSGDGGSPLNANLYAPSGLFTVTTGKVLVADSGNNRIREFTPVIAIPNQPPIASFAFSPSNPQTHLPITFDGSMSSDTDGTIATYTWTFGNGYSASGAIVTHTYTYTSAQTYTVTLTVTDNNGATHATSKTIEVLPGAVPDVSIQTTKEIFAEGEEIVVQYAGLPGNNTDWIALSAAGSSDTAYLRWVYTNGATSGTHTFDGLSAGSYEARVYFNNSYIVEARYAFTVGTPPANQTPTPEGPDVVVAPSDETGQSPLEMTFDNVLVAGETTLATVEDPPAPPPSGFQLGDQPIFFDLSTTAVFDGAIEICYNYSWTNIEDDAGLRMFHFEDGAWVDVTTSLDTANDILCGSVTSLSPFAIFETANQPPDISQARPSIAELWPANNKMVIVEILGVTDPDGDDITIEMVQITQDEPVDDKGKGNFAPDGGGLGTDRAQVRAERLGNGNGRVYEISFIAYDGKGGESQGSVTVCVPHNKGRGTICVDDGRLYDSVTGEALGAVATKPAHFQTDNFPNPFNPVTTIQYALPDDAHVSLIIYNALGQQVRTLVQEFQPAGHYRITWDSKDVLGRPVSSGVYIYRLVSNNHMLTRQMLLLK